MRDYKNITKHRNEVLIGEIFMYALLVFNIIILLLYLGVE